MSSASVRCPRSVEANNTAFPRHNRAEAPRNVHIAVGFWRTGSRNARPASPSANASGRRSALIRPTSLKEYQLLNAHERSQPMRTLRTAQVSKRLRLDLADPLAAQVELLGDLSERVLVIEADPESHADNCFFVGRQGL